MPSETKDVRERKDDDNDDEDDNGLLHGFISWVPSISLHFQTFPRNFVGTPCRGRLADDAFSLRYILWISSDFSVLSLHTLRGLERDRAVSTETSQTGISFFANILALERTSARVFMKILTRKNVANIFRENFILEIEIKVKKRVIFYLTKCCTHKLHLTNT